MSLFHQSVLVNTSSHEVTVLTPEDYQAVFMALDSPLEPNQKLKDAFIRYGNTAVQRAPNAWLDR